MPGVSESSGSGIGRFGRGFPVLGHVSVVDLITVVVRVIDFLGGENAEVKVV